LGALGAWSLPVGYIAALSVQGIITAIGVLIIVFGAIIILYTLKYSGGMETIQYGMQGISRDKRIQAIIIGYMFAAFIEGAAGFGTPVAITAAMLAGLGFNPLYAASICLIANTAPVAWGAIGIPIVVGGQVSGIPDLALSQMVGRTLPIVSVFIPLYLVVLMAGWKKGIEVWPACLVSGGSFAIAQFFSANSPLTAPLLPDIIASLVSIICTVAFLKIWHPKESWHFEHEPKREGKEKLRFTGGQIFRAWAPFIILSLFVCAWGIKPVNQALNQMTTMVFDYAIPIAGLDKMVIDQVGKAKPAVYNLNVLSAAGTAILFAWFFSIMVMGASLKTAAGVAGDTLKTLKWPIVTIATILGFAYIMNFSGMAITLGYAFATTGAAFPFFASLLGWLGVFMTGSDTSTNALFGKLQAVTAEKLAIDPVITMSANTCGGVCGKMISPQSIAVATGATGLVGRESEIFRFTFKHSIFLVVIIGILHMLWTYVFPGIVPTYVKPVAAAAAAVAAATVNRDGLMWLGIFMGIVALVTVFSRVVGANLVGSVRGDDQVHFH